MMLPEKPRDEAELSRSAIERRETLLRELRPVVARRGRRRVMLAVARRASAAALVVAAIAWGVEVMSGRADPTSTSSHESVKRETTEIADSVPRLAEAVRPASKIEYLQTRTGISEVVGLVKTGTIARATDHDLIAALLQTGQEPDVVRVDRRVVVAGSLGRQ